MAARGRADDPFLAIGMVVSPFNFDRRALVRDTMLRYEPVIDGAIAFRFILGSAVRPHGRDAANASSLESQLRRELRTRSDIVVVDALDGQSVDTQVRSSQARPGAAISQITSRS